MSKKISLLFRLAMSSDEKKGLGHDNPGLDFSAENGNQKSSEKLVS